MRKRLFQWFLLLGLLALAACSSTSKVEATATATPKQSTCQTSQLTLAYDRSSGLVGNRADQFALQNTSTSPCTLFGYPQVQLLLADRQPTPTHATQATRGYLFQTTLKVVALPAGAKAYFIIEWVAGLCVNWAATAGQFVQVSLPGATGILTTPVRSFENVGIDACGNIVVSPVFVGSALYGTS